MGGLVLLALGTFLLAVPQKSSSMCTVKVSQYPRFSAAEHALTVQTWFLDLGLCIVTSMIVAKARYCIRMARQGDMNDPKKVRLAFVIGLLLTDIRAAS